MQKIILVRYGEWEHGHINEAGRQTITVTAERLKGALGLSLPERKTKVCVVSAEVPRAVESAKLIAAGLDINSTTSLPQLYAAEEDGRLPDAAAALEAIQGVERLYSREYAVIIAVASREYIETLPAYVLETVFNQPSSSHDVPALERGQALCIDWGRHDTYLL